MISFNLFSPKINALNISIEKINISGFALPRSRDDDKRRYGGALDSNAMHTVYTDLTRKCYKQNLFTGYQLPYSIELMFFKDGRSDELHYEFDQVVVRNNPDNAWQADPTNPVGYYTEDFLTRLRTAIKNSSRHWDEHDQTNQIRIGRVDRQKGIIEVSMTKYNAQVITNLAMDLPRTPGSHHTLRTQTAQNGAPPPLDFEYEPKLANSLGIAILFFYKGQDGKWLPLVPSRDKVIVFNEEWGCSSSFAARWDTIAQCLQKDECSLKEMISKLVEQHAEWELKLVPGMIKKLVPLAFTREWFRGGKPQLFFAGFTDMTRNQIVAGIQEAEHREEIEKTSFLKSLLGAERYSFMTTKNKKRYQPSIEYMMNLSLAQDYLSFNKV